MQRRNITDMRRGSRSMHGASGSVASAALLLDAVAAAGGGTADSGVSVSRLLRDGYTGPLFRGRRTTGGAQQDCYADAETGLLDTAALSTFANGSAVTVVTVYDQSGNGRDWTHANTAYQPTIWNATQGLVTHENGEPTIYWDGFRMLLQAAHGLSGASALTVAFDANSDREITSAHTPNTVVHLLGTARFTASLAWYPKTLFGAPNQRARHPAHDTTGSHGYVFTSAASGQLSAVKIYQDGDELGAKPTGYGPADNGLTTTLNLGAGGGAWGSNESNLQAFRGRSGSVIVWPVALDGAALAAVHAFHDAMLAPGDADFTGSPLVVMAGQSNAELFSYTPASIASYPFDVRYDGRHWAQAGFSGSNIDQWQKGALTDGLTSNYAELLALAQRADPAQPLGILWIQGEADATDARSPGHAAKLAQLVSDLGTDIGRDFLWIDVLLGISSGSGTLAGRTQVNNDKTALASSRGIHGATIDVDALAGGYTDTVHYDSTRMTAVYGAAKTLMDGYAP